MPRWTQRIVALLSLCVVCSPGPASAQVQVVSADDLGRILGALAAVIQTRAKEVAADTLRVQLNSDLCTHRQTAITRRRQGSAETLTLWFGGRPECFSGNAECDSNDVFVRTCRLLSLDSIDVTDPHLLQEVGRDTVSFGVRIGAFSIPSAKEYEDLRLPQVADFVYDLMAALKGGRIDQEAVIESTLQFAERLGKNADADLATSVMKALGAEPQTSKAIRATLDVWKQLCQAPAGKPAPASDAEACEYVRKFPIPIEGDLVPDSAACMAFNSPESTKARDDRFKWLFETSEQHAGAYVAAQDETCAAAFPTPPEKVVSCRAAQLGRLLDMLYKPLCLKHFSTGNLRQALYVLYWQRPIFDGALGEVSTLRPLLQAMKPPLSRATAAELATILKVVASGIRASRAAPTLTNEFLARLSGDMTAVPAQGYRAILNGRALSWASREKLDVRVRDFRDNVKNLFALPVFAAGIEASISSNQINLAISILNSLVAGIKEAVRDAPQPERAVLAAANLASTLSSSVSQLASTMPPDATPQQQRVAQDLAVLSKSLSIASQFLTLLANRDWVGVALAASFELAVIEGERSRQPEVLNSLAFMRMLMSVYQAKTTDEAKAIFSSQLESKSSRRERYRSSAVDVASLVGARFGWQKDSVTTSSGDTLAWNASPQSMGGLYVPVGLQGTYKWGGLLLYPVDLGAYLVASPDATSVKAYDAVRFGAAALIRFSARYPIDLCISADYRPALDNTTPQLRYGFAIGLELPLYLIK